MQVLKHLCLLPATNSCGGLHGTPLKHPVPPHAWCSCRGRDQPPGSDPCHLYVGYLAPHVTEAMLEGLFRSCGEVSRQGCGCI